MAPSRPYFELAFLPDHEIRFRLEFPSATDAAAFASAFDGVLPGEAAGDFAACRRTLFGRTS